MKLKLKEIKISETLQETEDGLGIVRRAARQAMVNPIKLTQLSSLLVALISL